jgi:hypothetical protein
MDKVAPLSFSVGSWLGSKLEGISFRVFKVSQTLSYGVPNNSFTTTSRATTYLLG